MLGSWQLIRQTEFSFQYESTFEVEIENDIFWYFEKDNLTKLNYPRFANQGEIGYKFRNDSLYILNNDFAESYKVISSFDTLILCDASNMVSIQYYYFVRKDLDVNIVNQLKTDIVDWSLFQKKWEFSSFIPENSFERYCICPFFAPDTLDLTVQNKANYFTSSDTLYYNSADLTYAYQLSFVQGNNIYLSVVCPERKGFSGFMYSMVMDQ